MPLNFPRFSVVIPTFTFDVGPCLQAVRKFSSNDIEVIVVANGCPPEKIRKLNEFPFARILRFDEAIGYTRAANEGILASKGELVVLLNDDAVLLDQAKDEWLRTLEKPFLEDPRMGITGPYMNWSPEAEFDFLIFFCVMINRRLFEEIGVLDEVFSPGYGEDTAFCVEALRAGWKIAQVPKGSGLQQVAGKKQVLGNFPIFHSSNETFRDWPGGEDLLRKNRGILHSRYAPKVEEAKKIDGWVSDEELLWLASKVRTRRTVIEVGSWHGKSTRALADNLPPKGRVFAVDHWNGSATEPFNHGTARLRDGDDAFLEFSKNNFDLLESGKIVPMRMTSKNAAAMLKDRGVKADMIFIDGGHEYEEVKADIEAYLPLLALEGILCGHDYGPWPGVPKAVDELLGPKAKESVHSTPNNSIWSIAAEEVRPGRVFDTFPFFNEFDVLRIRLETLEPLVTKFVITEADRTHQGEEKGFALKTALEGLPAQLAEKIEVVEVSFPTEVKDTWARERYQRDAAKAALEKYGVGKNDIVIVSDVDEIPNPEALKMFSEQGWEWASLGMELSYFYLNNRCVSHRWEGHAHFIRGDRYLLETPCGIRYGKPEMKIEDGGWHFSYLTGDSPAAVAAKIKAFAHEEYNKPDFTDEEKIAGRIRSGTDPFDRPGEIFEAVPLDDSFPPCVHNPAFAQYVKRVAGEEKILCFIPTRNRYFSTLPLAIMGVAMQTRPPDHLLLYDDGEKKDLRTVPLYEYLFRLLDEKKIGWEVMFGDGRGQHFGHQKSQEKPGVDFVWRLDDDEVPEPACLENLLKEMGSGVGAVGGLVLLPGNAATRPAEAKNTVLDMGLPNVQWFKWATSAPEEVDHLTSTFLYRPGIAEYERSLSPAAHREETMFTYSLKEKGWKIIATPAAVTWHLRNPEGGIREHRDQAMWEHDERVFKEFLAKRGLAAESYRPVVLDGGIGDHLAFCPVLEEMMKRWKVRVYCVFPEVFLDYKVPTGSLEDAKRELGDISRFNVYARMTDWKWTGHITEAYRKIYL